MIDAQVSLDAARRVSLGRLTAYLRASGWRQLAPEAGLPIFSIDFPGAEGPIILPLAGDGKAHDERRRIADALETLAVLEERGVSEVVQAIERRSAASRSRRRSGLARPITAIDGLSTFAGSKLKSVGIRTTGALLEAAGTLKGRRALSAKTGIDQESLLEWANIADYMRIPGMAKAKLKLLRAAGVPTVRKLAAFRNPTRLAQALKRANNERHFVRVLPSERSVEHLIEQARKVAPKAVDQ
jgi:hypothetical protein